MLESILHYYMLYSNQLGIPILQKNNNFFQSYKGMKFLMQTGGGFWYEPKATHISQLFFNSNSYTIQAIFWPKASESTVGISIILSPQEMAPSSQRSKTHRKPIWCRIQLSKNNYCSLTPAVDTYYSIKLNTEAGASLQIVHRHPKQMVIRRS